MAIDARTKMAVFSRDGFQCYYCGNVMNRPELKSAPWTPSIDHKTPLSKGGTDDLSNLVTCCKRCNSEKGNRTIAEYVEMRNLRSPTWQCIRYLEEYIGENKGVAGIEEDQAALSSLRACWPNHKDWMHFEITEAIALRNADLDGQVPA